MIFARKMSEFSHDNCRPKYIYIFPEFLRARAPLPPPAPSYAYVQSCILPRNATQSAVLSRQVVCPSLRLSVVWPGPRQHYPNP